MRRRAGAAGLGILAASLAAASALAQDVTSPGAFEARAAQVAGAGAGGLAVAAMRDTLNCTIRPLRTVEVSSLINGVVAEVMVRPGQRVAPGDPLVRLDTSLMEADLAVARAVAEARAALDTAIMRRDGLSRRAERLRAGYERNAVSEADYEDAELDLDLAEGAVAEERQRIRLARAEAARMENQVASAVIRAQVGGVVGENLIDPGEGTQGRPIATIYDNDPLRVEVYVPTAQLSQVMAAERHAIVLPDGPQGAREHPVRLDYAAQVGDVASNTISVFFFLEADDVLAGSRCTMPAPRQEM
ncbi:HlyD family efflux transporter periplasmic adaptor subunit [Roseibacterium sp. SDUM158017]|uniref:efflux RND transporter periplasmic adaptor subunit n=1 Tax=Roseicyclus salinarum TaxID=3036773 RepID=UPI002415965D|nr:HlyD family efflux transporter periplasmic adaptor subunit [Roseibacterium sp. SDUM158017]MDG4650074.1 HlyD family efflux transporter periplasmic adaptor subunit [Roseibacterium sp. SDUM158017]